MPRSLYQNTVMVKGPAGAIPLAGAAVEFRDPTSGNPISYPLYADGSSPVPLTLPYVTGDLGELEVWADQPHRVRITVTKNGLTQAQETVDLEYPPEYSATVDDVNSAIAAHEAKDDPHPQYLTEERGDLRYLPIDTVIPPPVDLSNYWTKTQSDARYQPAGTYLTPVDADARYLQLSGGTITGPVTVEDGAILSARDIRSGPDNYPLGVSWDGDNSLEWRDNGFYVTASDPATFDDRFVNTDGDTMSGMLAIQQGLSPGRLFQRPDTQEIGLTYNVTYTDDWHLDDPSQLGILTHARPDAGVAWGVSIWDFTTGWNTRPWYVATNGDTMIRDKVLAVSPDADNALEWRDNGLYGTGGGGSGGGGDFLPLAGGVLTGNLTVQYAPDQTRTLLYDYGLSIYGSDGFKRLGLQGQNGGEITFAEGAIYLGMVDEGDANAGLYIDSGLRLYGHLTPNGTTRDLGQSGSRWRKLWATDADFTNPPTVGGAALSTLFLPLAGGTLTGPLEFDSDSAALVMRMAADVDYRFFVGVDGTLGWADGAGAQRASLYAQAANDLRTTASLTPATTNARDLGAIATRWRSAYLGTVLSIAGASATANQITHGITTDSQPRLIVDGNGQMKWGPGASTAQDTYLFRAGVASLGLSGGGTGATLYLGTTGISTKALQADANTRSYFNDAGWGFGPGGGAGTDTWFARTGVNRIMSSDPRWLNNWTLEQGSYVFRHGADNYGTMIYAKFGYAGDGNNPRMQFGVNAWFPQYGGTRGTPVKDVSGLASGLMLIEGGGGGGGTDNQVPLWELMWQDGGWTTGYWSPAKINSRGQLALSAGVPADGQAYLVPRSTDAAHSASMALHTLNATTWGRVSVADIAPRIELLANAYWNGAGWQQDDATKDSVRWELYGNIAGGIPIAGLWSKQGAGAWWNPMRVYGNGIFEFAVTGGGVLRFQTGGPGNVQITNTNGGYNVEMASAGGYWHPNADNVLRLGAGSHRFVEICSVNGALNTSSIKYKDPLGSLDPEAALAAVLATPARRFKYKGTERVQSGYYLEEADPLFTIGPDTASPSNDTGILLGAIQALCARLGITL